MKSVFQAAVFAGALSSCAHFGPAPAGPEAAARAYADALEQGRVDDAFALSSGLDLPRFKTCYGDSAVRSRRASEVRAAADGKPVALRLVMEGGAWRVQELEAAKPAVEAQAAEALTRFLDAAEQGDFEAALKLVAPSLRARYSVERFKSDFEHEPLAKERLSRARTALRGGAWTVVADGAELPLGGGKAVRLSREGDAYRVVALE
jgi:hypothetical protein